MQGTTRTTLALAFAMLSAFAIKLSFFEGKQNVAYASGEPKGAHDWILDSDTSFSASLEPWPVKTGELTNLIVWESDDPAYYRVVSEGRAQGNWKPLERQTIADDVEDDSPAHLHKARFDLPAGEVSIELRVSGADGKMHELTGWCVKAKK